MSIKESNNNFDWVDSLYVAKCNFTEEECINVVKKTIESKKGVDLAFLEYIRNSNENTFSVEIKYVPVYTATANATYTWDTDKTERAGDFDVTTTTRHTERKSMSEDFSCDEFKDCKLGELVGRNDERIYEISHVDDLRYPVTYDFYNPKMIEAGLESLVIKSKPKVVATYHLDSWSCFATLIPIAFIKYTFNGINYFAKVNMHNGKDSTEYLISKEVEKKAKKAKTISTISKIINIAVPLVSAFLGAILSLFVAIINIVLIVKLKHNKNYYNNLFGTKGAQLSIAKAVLFEIIQTVVSVVLSIVFILTILL